MKNQSYFSFGDIFNLPKIIDRLFNPYTCNTRIRYKGNEVAVSYTSSADKALLSRSEPMIVEMQLYFSCVVMKRVLFHDSLGLETVPVNDKLSVVFNTVESASCDPVQFAQNHPARRILDSEQALRMRPKTFMLDYKKNHWIGEFTV